MNLCNDTFSDNEMENFMDDYDIIEADDYEENKILTNENISHPHKTSDLKISDIFFEITKTVDKNKLILKCNEIFSSNNVENIAQLTVIMFQTRNCRNGKSGIKGKGEREIFYSMFLSFSRFFPKTCEKFFPLISEYGCFKDFLFLLPNFSPELQKSTISYMCRLLLKDILILEENEKFNCENCEECKISLIAKWMPREGLNFASHNPKIFLNIIKEYNNIRILTCKIKQKAKYRKDISKLSRYIDVTEIKMCSNNYSKIDYRKTPFANISKFKKAHLNEKVSGTNNNFDEKIGNRYIDRHDRIEARQNFLTNKKINDKQIEPHFICDSFSCASSSEKIILSKQWNEIKNDFLKYNSNFIAVSDVSESMTGLPMSISIALGILTSELNKGFFGGKIITFDSNPEIINLDKKLSLEEKLKTVSKMNCNKNTDLTKIMDLILNIAIQEKINDEDLPTLLIFSGVEFDSVTENSIITHMNAIDNKFDECGYKIPNIVFWNLKDKNNTHVKSSYKNVVLLSGYSHLLFKKLFSGKFQNETKSVVKFLEIINDPIYDSVRNIIISSDEGIFSDYS